MVNALQEELPPPEPTIEEMVLEVAIEGGYLNRESDGPPGAQVLWRGLDKLRSAVVVFEHYAQLIHSAQSLIYCCFVSSSNRDVSDVRNYG